MAVDVTGHAQSRTGAHQPGEQRVVGQRVLHRDRVAVGVEQPAAALDGGADVAQVLDGEPAAHVPAPGHAVVELEHHPARSVREAQGAGVPARPPGLHAWHSVGGEEGEHLVGGVRRAHGQPQLEGAGRRCAGPTPPGGAELGGRGGVDLADGVVELADAGEPGGERHVAEGHRRGLHEHPRGLRPAGPGQGERPGPELGDEQPVEVPRGVAHPVREPLDPVALDDPVGDQPHRAAGDVGGHVPVR